MIQRIAASLALTAFAVCLLVGGLDAENPFATTVWRALQAMFATLIVGLVLGAMAKAMIRENLDREKEKLKNSQPKTSANDR
jgi:UDP-N-acetylmuramoylalanine-D-glutamate ligase